MMILSNLLPRAVSHGLTAICLTAFCLVPVLGATNPVPQALTRDKVAARTGVFRNGSSFTGPGGGRTGAATDFAVDFGARSTGPVYVQDGTFFNVGAAKDQLSVAFWAKKYDIAAGSAFWAVSPASNNSQRGYQAHVPWSDNVLYFDTAGCCNADQRISANIDTFPEYTGDLGWWTNNWHHFVFSKNAGSKQIWIDGKLFLEGTDAAPLPTDFVDLYIGSSVGGGGQFHALMDDFAVFSSQLAEADVVKLATGTSPSALPVSTGLLAFWDFNDYPAEGVFGEVSPLPNTATGSPNLIRVVHIDGSTPWTSNNVTLAIDGKAVTADLKKEGSKATLTYLSPTLFAIQSKHKVTLTYPGSSGQPQTLEWEFIVGPYTKDTVQSRLGVFTGGSTYTADAGGHTGKAGDYAVEFGPAGTGPVQVEDGAFLNGPSAQDEMTFALWVKKYDIAASSAFWAVSPSSSEGQRGFQAHIPWSNNQLYFDTSGCCGAETQRINASITEFPDYSGDVGWWTNWHHFVFSKKGAVKQIWIDGKLFLEGNNTMPLPTDFTRLVIGADSGGGNRIHGLIDDFAVFSKQLSESEVVSLFNGTAPSGLPASTGLLALWNFNDIPPQGIFISFAPTPETTNAVPSQIKVLHLQGTTPWDLTKVGLKIDGSAVVPTTTREGSRVTISYTPDPIFAIGSTHTAEVSFPNPDGTIGTQQWQFTVSPYTQDTTHKYVGQLLGPTKYTADGGGHSGAAGDYAVDFGRAPAGQGVLVVNPAPLNEAAANDEMAVAAWQKLHVLVDSALFFGVAPSSSAGARGWGNFPWSNGTIYFDTAGCCDAETQRVNAAIDTFSGYTDASWWTNWHHFVYQKKGEVKEVWIDGQPFLQGQNTAPLPKDFTEGYIGVDYADNARMQGIVDDFAIFGTFLDQANIAKLASGTAPTGLPASARLLAYWNFNDATPSGTGGRPALSVAASPQAGKVRLTFEGTLESATTINGTWSPVTGASSPYDATIAEAKIRFYRAKK